MTSAGIIDDWFGRYIGDGSRLFAANESKQVFNGGSSQFIDGKRNCGKHRGGIVPFRGSIAAGYSNVFRDAVACGKGGSKEQQSQTVVVADNSFRCSCLTEKCKCFFIIVFP